MVSWRVDIRSNRVPFIVCPADPIADGFTHSCSTSVARPCEGRLRVAQSRRPKHELQGGDDARKGELEEVVRLSAEQQNVRLRQMAFIGPLPACCQSWELPGGRECFTCRVCRGYTTFDRFDMRHLRSERHFAARANTRSGRAVRAGFKVVVRLIFRQTANSPNISNALDCNPSSVASRAELDAEPKPNTSLTLERKNTYDTARRRLRSPIGAAAGDGAGAMAFQ